MCFEILECLSILDIFSTSPIPVHPNQPFTNMTSLRPFKATDVFNFNLTNLDPLTETYDLNFYFRYLAEWPHLFNVAVGTDGTIDAYCEYLNSI